MSLMFLILLFQRQPFELVKKIKNRFIYSQMSRDIKTKTFPCCPSNVNSDVAESKQYLRIVKQMRRIFFQPLLLIK